MNAARWLLGLALLTFDACSTSDSGCNPDEVPFGGFCYYFHNQDQIKQWQEAEDYCVRRESHLISVHSRDEFNFLNDQVQWDWTWIGLKKTNEDHLKFTDGTLVDDNPWYNFDWTPLNISECALMDNNGCMYCYKCDQPFSFICKKAKGLAPNPLQQPVWSDDCGWWVRNPSNDFCYLFSNNYWTTWYTARAVCNAKDGDMLSITDLNEQTFLQDSLQVFWNGTSLWMGGYKYGEGNWQWSDGSWVSYILWSADDPSAKHVERCLYLHANNGHWEEETCDSKRGFICKKRKAAKR